jgi:hypothetical protein
MRAAICKAACRRGFGLPTTILMIVIFAILGLVGLSVARQELRTQALTRSRGVAFYAAETGLARGVENWSTPAGLILPGTTWLLGEGPLAGGASYRVTATRLDDGSSVHAIYTLRSQGTARGGRSLTMGLLVATLPIDMPFRAALTVRDSARLAGTADVIGYDQMPSSWGGAYCNGLDENMAGLSMGDSTWFEKRGGAKLQGSPRLEQFSDTTGFFDFGGWTFEELAAQADITLPAGDTLAGQEPQPSYNADGSCDTSDPYNWGDPENPGRPCSSWFPIIYVPGDVSLQATQAGQGILLVDGDLRASGGFRFYGPVIVKGSLVADGGFSFYGGVKAKQTDLGAGNAQIFYSACVLQRAMSNSGVSRPQPLVERPWFQKR